jgi:hypothetical protein
LFCETSYEAAGLAVRTANSWIVAKQLLDMLKATQIAANLWI